MTNRLAPPNPADQYPLREYNVALKDLVGDSIDQVLAKLGKPDHRSKGNRWLGPDFKTYVRQADGKMAQLHVFGVTPQKIPVGDPYEEWFYQNVRGSNWLLFFVKNKVFEVAQYPVGAVF